MNTPDLSTLLAQLTQPQAFPYALLLSETVELVQTHASAVLLAGDHAYKLKKPHDFGFFNFSTPALRQHFCEQEVTLNSRLALQVYEGVAPVLATAEGTFHFGATYPPGDVPAPGTTIENGQVVDYAVVMQRLPENATLASRVAAGTATPELLSMVAEPLARFHTSVPTNEYIKSFGTVDVIRGNWEENLEQMRPYIDRSLNQETFDRISTYVQQFLEGYAALFDMRIREQYIRDCHGDLRLQHVYILQQSPSLAGVPPLICIVDCIEFNERFRFGDVASEIAFLVMELDAARCSDLAQSFLASYAHLTNDQGMYELLSFYKCYRACVRGKVLSFQLDQPEVPSEQKEAARLAASAFFTLAADYAKGPTQPTLLLVGGLIGTGKSTLASRLREELGWVLISSDTIRKQLAQLEPSEPQSDALGEGLYSANWNARVYQELVAQASTLLASGLSVILDATFAQRVYRDAAAQQAVVHGARPIFIECQCPRELTIQRLATRWQARLARQAGSIEIASDGRPDLYDAKAVAWQQFDFEEEQTTRYLALSTSSSSPDLKPIFDILRTP